MDEENDYNLANNFEKSFYGKEAVDRMRQDRVVLYDDMVNVIGKMRLRSGMNKKDNAFFISKKKVYSRALLRIAPHLGVMPKDDAAAPIEPSSRKSNTKQKKEKS